MLTELTNPDLSVTRETIIQKRDYLSDFKNITVTEDIDRQLADKYTGDAVGYLLHLDIPPDLIEVTMDINNIKSSSEFDDSIQTILIPKRDITDVGY